MEPPTQAAHEMDPAKKNTFNTPLDKQWVGINFKASFLISIQSIFRYMVSFFQKTDSIMEEGVYVTNPTNNLLVVSTLQAFVTT